MASSWEISAAKGAGRPVVLSLVYYRCPGLCTMTLNGMSRSFKPLQFSAGKEFEVPMPLTSITRDLLQTMIGAWPA